MRKRAKKIGRSIEEIKAIPDEVLADHPKLKLVWKALRTLEEALKEVEHIESPGQRVVALNEIARIATECGNVAHADRIDALWHLGGILYPKAAQA